MAGLFSRMRAAGAAFVAKDTGGAAAAVGANQGGGGFLPTLGATPSASGLLISQGTAMAVSAVYACVTIRAQDVARCTPRLFYTNPKSGTRDPSPVREHDIVELWKKPNRQQTYFEWIEQQASGYLLRGNGYSALKGITKHGQVDELIPVNPDAVLVLEGWDGGIYYNVNRIGLWQNAMLREFPPALSDWQVLHFKGLTFNALVAISNIHMARDAVGIAMGLEQQASRWMQNGARPSVVLQAKNKLSEPAARRLKQQWDDFKAGIQNTGQAVILEEGMEAKPLQLTSTDIAFIEQRKFEVEDICRFYRVPPFKLGATELRGIDIEEINNDYVSGTIMPDLHRFEQRMEKTFALEEQNLTVSFDERALLRSATKTRFANNRLGLGGASFLTINEVRAGEQLPPVPGGDVLYQPSNLAAAGSDRSGLAPDGAGRPPGDEMPAPSPAPAKPEGDSGKAFVALRFKGQAGQEVALELDEIGALQVESAIVRALRHRKDTKRTLYVSRQLLNAEDLIAWAKTQGFAATLTAADMHVTVAFSRASVDWSATPARSDTVRIPPTADRAGERSVERLGDKGAVVLRFESAELTDRWQEFRDAGASWDWPGYKPHVTLTYQAPADLDVATLAPYQGELRFGPERFATVDENWTDRVTENAASGMRFTLPPIDSKSLNGHAPATH
jgi:HK97 family phage portal protein